jgi:AcrR family transcriptional regulator
MGRKRSRAQKPGLVRPWRQQRSAATVERIREAVMRLLARKDFDSISVDEIVELAQTSKGAFYFRFATKSHLLRYLAEETFTALSQESRAFFQMEKTARLPLALFLRAFIEHVTTVYVERRNLLRAFLREDRPGGDDVVVTLVKAGSGESARMLVEALLVRKDEIRHAKPEIAVSLAAMVLGVMLRYQCLTVEQVALFPGTTPESVWRELQTMLGGYLRQPGPT